MDTKIWSSWIFNCGNTKPSKQDKNGIMWINTKLQFKTGNNLYSCILNVTVNQLTDSVQPHTKYSDSNEVKNW